MMVSEERVNAGRILIVGSQGGGKTALATKVASVGNPKAIYKEEFGGTIETEYLKASYDKGKLFSLLLPIGGQEKWSSLRTAFGETAEGQVIVMDSTTKLFWPSSLLQARQISPVIPYENFPLTAVISKEDQNRVFQKEIKNMARAICSGFEDARRDGTNFYSRGFKIIARSFKAPSTGPIPFSFGEQIIVNSLEKEYFEDVIPGQAGGGKRKLKAFSLVNCRLFSRALASSLAQTEERNVEEQMAFLSLLNDMRPTLLELDVDWNTLLKKYPKAGSEPMIPQQISEADVEETIKKKLLATDGDIAVVKKQIEELSSETGWVLQDILHTSVFTDEGLKIVYEALHRLLQNVKNAKLHAKFRLLDPLEELF